MNAYNDGELVRITGVFRNEAGVPTDPLNVTVQYTFTRSPVVVRVFGTDPEVIRLGPGEFRMDIDTTDHQGEQCSYRIYSTGNGQAANEGQFRVRLSRVLT